MASSSGRWLTIALWLTVISWSLGLGGKLFEFVVVISAWGARPPESLSLMPYGPRYPHNPGDYFQPLGILALLGSVGALIAGRCTRPGYRVLLWLPFVALLLTAVATPTLFWPMIRALYRAGTGTEPLAEAAARALVHRWILFDLARTMLGVVAFGASVQALATRHRAASG